jgi:signal transduction histidine kinase
MSDAPAKQNNQQSDKSEMWPLDMFDQADELPGNNGPQNNRQLTDELREVTALYNVGVVLNSSLNSKEVLWAVYKESSRLVDTSNFALALLDTAKKQLNFMLVFVNGSGVKPFSVPVTGPLQLCGSILKSQSPRLIDNLSETDHTFELGKKVNGLNIGAWLGVPVINPALPNSRVQGVIAIWQNKPAAYNEHDLWLMSAIGTQVSIALRNARLYESSQRRATEMSRLKDIAQRQAEEMRFLNDVGRILASTLHLDKVLTTIMEQVDEMLVVEAGSLLLTDPATGDLIFQIALGEKASEVKPFRVPRGQGIAGQVAQSGKPLVIADVQKDKRHFKAVDRKTQFFTRNILCVPLVLHAQVVGVLQVLNKKNGDFTNRDVELLTSISSYAAIAIENARLYETLESEHTRTIQVEQDARRKLASDLHDGPTQLVAAIMMNLDFATKALEKDPSLLPGAISEMQELASRASHQMRTLLFELRPLVLEKQGLGAALQVFLDRRQKDVGDKARLSLKIDTEDPSGDITRQDGKVETTIFALVQETVNNAIKHAKAKNIVVTLKETVARIILTVADDGVGFDVDSVLTNYESRGSLGMVNTRERAESIGGDLTIDSKPGQGTRIVVDLPKEQAEIDARIKSKTVAGMLSTSTSGWQALRPPPDHSQS